MLEDLMKMVERIVVAQERQAKAAEDMTAAYLSGSAPATKEEKPSEIKTEAKTSELEEPKGLKNPNQMSRDELKAELKGKVTFAERTQTATLIKLVFDLRSKEGKLTEVISKEPEAPAPEAPAPEAPAADPTPEKKYTREEVTQAGMAAVRRIGNAIEGKEKVREICRTIGKSADETVAGVDPSTFGDVIKACEALGNG